MQSEICILDRLPLDHSHNRAKIHYCSDLTIKKVGFIYSSEQPKIIIVSMDVCPMYELLLLDIYRFCRVFAECVSNVPPTHVTLELFSYICLIGMFLGYFHL